MRDIRDKIIEDNKVLAITIIVFVAYIITMVIYK